MITFEREDARGRIEVQALALAGMDKIPANSEAFFWAAVNTACSICAREDICEEMECALAVILSQLYTEGFKNPVSSVKRGDTSITYVAGASMNYRLLLAPFVRLRTVFHG